jgi:uncharacterized membrane protein
MPKWIHDRADHILSKHPDMSKSEAFAIATQQAHKLGKTPKGYGTVAGKQEAEAKYDAPKSSYKKTAGIASRAVAALKDKRVQEALLEEAVPAATAVTGAVLAANADKNPSAGAALGAGIGAIPSFTGLNAKLLKKLGSKKSDAKKQRVKDALLGEGAPALGGIIGAGIGARFGRPVAGSALGASVGAIPGLIMDKEAAKADDNEEMSAAQKATVGGAALAPFGGMVGRKKIIHDPLQGAKGKEYKTMDALSRAAMPGDVVVTTKPKGSLFKRFISPIGGSEFYHTQGVIDRAGGHGLTTDVGHLPASTPASRLRAALPTVANYGEEYPDMVLLRPKKSLTKEQLASFSSEVARRSKDDVGYSGHKAFGSYLRELFVPQLGGVTGGGEQAAKKVTDLVPTHGRDEVDLPPAALQKFKSTGQLPSGVKMRPRVVCEGNFCSSVPSMALTESTGRQVLSGKKAKDVFPTDFLRSPEYELVGSHVSDKYAKGRAARLAKELGVRSAVGAGLAAGAYGATEKPEAAGAVAGALGASALANAVAKHQARGSQRLAEEALPTVTGTIRSHFINYPLPFKEMSKRFASRKLPIALAGAGLGAVGTHALMKHLSDKEKSASIGFKPFKPPALAASAIPKPPKLPGGQLNAAQRLKKSQNIGMQKAFDQKKDGIELQKFKPMSMLTPDADKVAFETSQYSGPLSYGPFKMRSAEGMPSNPGGIKLSGPPDLGDEESPDTARAHELTQKRASVWKSAHFAIDALGAYEKRATVTSPGSQLRSAVHKFSGPRMTAPGKSIAQIAKPKGFGTPLPGATKSASDKEAALRELVRLGLKDVPGAPRLVMKHRNWAQRAAVADRIGDAYDSAVTKPLMRGMDKAVLSRMPEGKAKTLASAGLKAVAQDPVGIGITSVVPVPGAQAAYLGAKKGISSLVDKLDPAPVAAITRG